MLRILLLLSLSITLLLTSAAAAWGCPQLDALLTETAIQTDTGGCPHHRNPAEPADSSKATWSSPSCCCTAPLPPAVLLAAVAPPLTTAPWRWHHPPHAAPPLSPLLRPPAPLHA